MNDTLVTLSYGELELIIRAHVAQAMAQYHSAAASEPMKKLQEQLGKKESDNGSESPTRVN